MGNLQRRISHPPAFAPFILPFPPPNSPLSSPFLLSQSSLLSPPPSLPITSLLPLHYLDCLLTQQPTILGAASFCFSLPSSPSFHPCYVSNPLLVCSLSASRCSASPPLLPGRVGWSLFLQMQLGLYWLQQVAKSCCQA